MNNTLTPYLATKEKRTKKERRKGMGYAHELKD
jgi:hypothetical protein